MFAVTVMQSVFGGWGGVNVEEIVRNYAKTC